jgi:broad specificity phosphatase PhoE
VSLLYLIRHPKTQPDPALPPPEWRLSPGGHAQVRALVAAPFWHQVAAMYTSQEPKTTLVGDAVQAAHGLAYTPVAELGEARRNTWIGFDSFKAVQHAFFSAPEVPAAPDWEPANTAQARFVAAIDGILAQHAPTDPVVVVTHGSVLALYVAHLRNETPHYEMWQQIGFAAIMAIDRATLRPLTAFLHAPYNHLPLP